MKDLFKNKFPLDRKRKMLSPAGVSGKIYKKYFILARNPFSLTRMNHLFKNTFPRYEKNTSSGKKIKENVFH